MSPSLAGGSDYAINSGSVGPCVPLATYKGVFQSLTSSTYNSKKVSLCQKGKTQSIALPAVSSAGHADDMLGPCESCSGPLHASNLKKFVTLANGDSWRKVVAKDKLLADQADMVIPGMQDGITFRMSRLQAASVYNGLSNTYLVGEKCVQAGTYEIGSAEGDSRPMMVGYSNDNARWGFDVPQQDDHAAANAAAFGSGHRAGWNVALADGSVRTVSFDIEAELHRRLLSRDGILRGDMAGIPPP